MRNRILPPQEISPSSRTLSHTRVFVPPSNSKTHQTQRVPLSLSVCVSLTHRVPPEPIAPSCCLNQNHSHTCNENMPVPTPFIIASNMIRHHLMPSLRTRGGSSGGPSQWTTPIHEDQPKGYLFNWTPPPDDIKESDTGLAAPSQWDLVSDKQMMQEEQPLQVWLTRSINQVARCIKIINPNSDDAKYVIYVKQIAKFVVGLGDKVSLTDVEEGMHVGVDRNKYQIQIPLPPKIDPIFHGGGQELTA